jgi:hypothetical protein
MTELGVRRTKAAFFSGCKSDPATIAPARSKWSSREGNEVAEAFRFRSQIPHARPCGKWQ